MPDMTQTRKRYDRQFKVAAAKVVLEGEMTVVDLSKELGIKDSTLRRWAKEYEEMGEIAFPGNGSPKTNKDYEILKLKKRIEDLETENDGENRTSRSNERPWRASWRTSSLSTRADTATAGSISNSGTPASW